jgi:tetratricopeptide (TPR) repeat protein
VPAIEAFERAVERNRKLDRAWYGMGLALAAIGRQEAAADAFERAAELQPMNGHAWYELGMAHFALGRSDKLKEVIAHLDRFDPKMAQHLMRSTEPPPQGDGT